MNLIFQQLKEWRANKAREENVELYLVMQNQTIEAIAKDMPQNKEEFIAIKGLGERKYEKYGEEILALINDENIIEEKLDLAGENIYSVSKFLDLINSKFASIEAKVKGEVSSVDIRSGYLFFTLKDAEDGSLMSCFMWSRDYELCGIDLEIGMEIIVHGVPDIYKPSGRFSLRADSVELVGEGALKKTYDELKKKLSAEGLFDESKKRQIPILPSRIGLITSKTGAVIHDFGNNLGRFGFVTKFYNSRVEGALAIRELTEAIKYFRDKEIDILVVIRGGGSMESLQAFNNEALIRQITNYPVPVLCGIGHDKDVPLFSLAADRALSTPTAVAEEINRSWEQAIEKVRRYESNIFYEYTARLANLQHKIDNYAFEVDNFYQKIYQKVSSIDTLINSIFNHLNYSLKLFKDNVASSSDRFGKFGYYISSSNSSLNNLSNLLAKNGSELINIVKRKITEADRILNQNNPERQLKLGYSILFSKGKIINTVDQLNKSDMLTSRLIDGEVISTVEEIRKRSNGEV